MDKIVIIDFGGQYCHLISRRIRDLGVETEIVTPGFNIEDMKNDLSIKGLILSGGAASVYDAASPKINKSIFELNLPILGICYGHQLIAHNFGGKVVPGSSGEYGKTTIKVVSKSLFEGLPNNIVVWMNHRDIVSTLPGEFSSIAETAHTKFAAYEHKKKKIYGLQFHPEVTHTRFGNKIFNNFVYNICDCQRSRSYQSIIKNIVLEAKTVIGDEKAIIGLSGGIDSSVAANLLSRAIGKNLTAVYVDTGLMREGETDSIRKMFSGQEIDLKIIFAAKRFFAALKGEADPEKKRKIIGKLFVDIFQEEATKTGAKFLVQGTIYSDRIESGLTKNSSNIKSHHNVGGLPKKFGLKVYEPLRDFYKDEVRKLGRKIKLPLEIQERQIFPGPGLAVRILGEVTPEGADIVRRAGVIIDEEIKKSRYYKRIWMSFPVLLPIKSVGIQGDERSYKYPIVLRIIESKDAMTANFSRIPFSILDSISNRITNEVKEVNRVVYDITNKPPATMEWE